jgi:hypothetical protein
VFDSSNDFSYIVERGIGNNAVRNDPPAFTSNVVSSLNPTPKDAPNSFTENETLTVDQEQEEVILHPRQVDLADSAMIKLETNDGNEMNDEEACVADDLTTEMIVNMFLRSKHGFDLHDKADSLSLNDVKERVDLYVLTHMDSSVSDDFKFKVADRVVYKIRSSESKSTETIVNMFLKSPHGYDLYQSDNKSSISNVKERVDIFVVTNMDSEVSDDFKMKVAQRIVDKVTHDEVIHLEHMNSTGSEFVPSSTQEVSATTTTGASPSPTLTIEECRDRLMDPSITLEEQIKLTSMLEKLADSPAATQSYLPQTQPKQSISFDFSENDIDQSTTNQR